MSLEDQLKAMTERLAQLAVELDDVLSNPILSGIELQRIGQEVMEISRRLELLEIGVSSARKNAAKIKARLI